MVLTISGLPCIRQRLRARARRRVRAVRVALPHDLSRNRDQHDGSVSMIADVLFHRPRA
jgi:hypothetical protein